MERTPDGYVCVWCEATTPISVVELHRLSNGDVWAHGVDAARYAVPLRVMVDE